MSTSDNLKADVCTAITFLSSQQTQFNIPDYQRAYEWKKSNIEEFISDISDLVLTDSEIDNGKRGSDSLEMTREYFIGTLIVSKGDDHNIIDGQQRSIT